MLGVPFHLEGQTVFYEKSSAAEGQRRRIAGVISTEARDRQHEVIIQKGLDFEPFITHGWFNDNHSKDTDAVVGYPTDVRQFQKGAELPNGKLAKTNCTWAEGYLLSGTPRADAIWTLGRALAKAAGDRSLGFSIEGTIHKRVGPGKRVVAQASVQNCAITNCPVNPGAKMEMLAKSLTAVQLAQDEDLVQKALSVGTPPANFEAVTDAVSGEGAGQILTRESLETDLKKKKKLKKSEAVVLLRERLPAGVSDDVIRGVVDLAITMGRQTTSQEAWK